MTQNLPSTKITASETITSNNFEIPTVHNQPSAPLMYIIVALIMGLGVALFFLLMFCLWKVWVWLNTRHKKDLSTAANLSLSQTTNENIDPIYETINDDLSVTNVNIAYSPDKTNENTAIDQIDTCNAVTEQIFVRNGSPLHITANEAYSMTHNIKLANNESYQICTSQMSNRDRQT